MEDNLTRFPVERIRFFLLWLMGVGVAFLISYWLSYHMLFHPKGYKVIEIGEQYLVLQQNTLIGLKDAVVRVTFIDGESWKIEKIVQDVKDMRLKYMFFYMTTSSLLYFFLLERAKDERLKKSDLFWLLISILLAWGTLAMELDRLHEFFLEKS
ncbi:hypothetical protein LCM20_06465 [Halobacillus litoralis]|uniref:hypothetical protein n=1 Tax=Halobacillus litoralis TaxID=45668 RepID=UPI001CD2112A|nr:hypothetical protein [Halobacillus litoralis]MCA0970224.1 hypothetical protein [Halobacillus litoralis]